MVKAASQQLLFNEIGNDVIARHLDEVADRLTEQGANPFRVAAYRRAAATLRDLIRPLRDFLDDEGRAGLLRLPGIGPSTGRAIEQFLQKGSMSRLEQLRGTAAPPSIFTTVAEIGPKLAAEIHSQLRIESLAELEAAAWDGRLARVPGMGRKRIQAVREALAGRFRKSSDQAGPPATARPIDQPPVAELLSIDEEYRRLAELDRLPRIAPRRMNPQHKAWLPILRAKRDGGNFTALYSNTARAHELGTTKDWVVIYRDEGPEHGQWTVITSRMGKLKGKRVVRGREQECAAFYVAGTLRVP